MNDFYTVTQYANITGKDPGNIRRMLISGKMKGEKIGKQWVIPRNVSYPEDKRIRNGKYCKNPDLRNSNSDMIIALNEMCIKLRGVYGDFLERIVLYGSYARGMQTPESDVDIALILKPGNTESMHDEMINIVVDFELEQAVTFSVVPIEYDQYKTWNRTLPFYRNIDKEGIVLWKEV